MKIDAGPARLQNGSFKIVHIIDMEAYEVLITNLEEVLKLKGNHSHPLYPILSYEILRIRSHLARLKINKVNKRSLDFIGSAWKWIAGNPDHHDHEILTNKVNNVLKNNNKQAIINRMTVEKINEITNMTNRVLRTFNENNNDKSILEIKYKLEVIKEEIVNVAYAIHWAKANIVNSYILSNTEINITEQLLKSENIPFINIDEALEFADVKIASDGKNIIYIVSLPTTSFEICNILIIKAVKIGTKINKIPFNSVLKCKENIYGINKECKSYNGHSICNIDNIIDISNTTCVPNLLRSQLSTCVTINNQHIPSFEEISPGVLFLNQYNASVTINNDTLRLKGTYIIKHVNTTIQVNGKTFRVSEITKHQPLPAILQPKSTLGNVEEELSLEMIKELQVNGTEEISLLRIKNNINLATNISLVMLLAILIVTYFFYRLIQQLKIRKGNKTKEEPVPTPRNAASITIGVEDIPHLIKPMTSNEGVRT